MRNCHYLFYVLLLVIQVGIADCSKPSTEVVTDTQAGKALVNVQDDCNSDGSCSQKTCSSLCQTQKDCTRRQKCENGCCQAAFHMVVDKDGKMDPFITAVVGIVECDAYIEKYELCINKMPEAARELAKKSLTEMATAWKEAAATPEARLAIGKTCEQAHNAARATLSSFNCEW